MMEFMPLVLFAVICLVLMFGYPVALSLAGTALAFAGLGFGLESLASTPTSTTATSPPSPTASTAS